jgi:hypothetical protein
MLGHASFAVIALIICSALILRTEASVAGISADTGQKVELSSTSNPYPRYWSRFSAGRDQGIITAASLR